MTTNISLSKYEKQVLPKFRDKLNQSESEEDVKKFFVETVERFLSLATDVTVRTHNEDIRLVPEQSPYYYISAELLNLDAMRPLQQSDLTSVLKRIAEPAAHRYQHLAKHPEKTKAKIKGH